MLILKDKLKSIFKKESYSVSDLVKRAAVTTAVIATLTLGTVSADNGGTDHIKTVYHVYVNDERLGTIDNKEIIEQYIQKREQEVLEENPQFSFGLDDNVVYIQEKVFRSLVDNDQVLEKLADKLEVLADASAIEINGEPVVFLENAEKTEEVFKALKLKYVSEEVLTNIESRDAGDPLPPLKEGESRILDVTFEENVTISNEKVSPADIYSTEEAVTYLTKGTLEEKKYIVQAGDVLGKIASKHELSLADLLALNPGMKEDTLIDIGDELNVTAYKPYIHVVVKEEVYKKESIAFKREVKENDKMYKGDKKVTQEGRNGERLVNYIVSKQNGQIINKETIKEEILKDPVTEIIEKGTKVIASRGTGSFAWPAVGGYISSSMGYRWGSLHKGIDIARPSNRNILAADNGVVTFTGYDGAYGNKIVINHNNGYKTIYAHLSSISVKNGQTVAKGQKIGIMGSTGRSTGIHLHFEVYLNGQLKNPTSYINR
ncbi:peptidoglycan DD-metalloendopeptidase family protein [Bacillus salitolerans]|uniref:Peptidoglycan DD-metalloendopeptidase family protein n=1 Tax=Bacillus salitolerans TaxID=1437434 RepID=A0ABW4LIP7_9BACI